MSASKTTSKPLSNTCSRRAFWHALTDLTWVSGRSFYRLSSPHCEVLPEALKVFGPHLSDSPGSEVPTYRLEATSSGGQWWVTPPHSARRRFASLARALLFIEYSAVALHLEDPNACVLHAALLQREGKGLALVGSCGSGKSTLAQALWRDGWDLLGDDSCQLGNSPDQGAWALARRASLRTGSFRWLEPDLLERILTSPGYQPIRKGLVFHPGHIFPTKPSDGLVDLRCVVFLTGRRADSVLCPLNSLEALRAVMPHSSAGRRGLRDGLQWLSPWADYWKAFRLGRQNLEQMVLQVNHLSTASSGGQGLQTGESRAT